MRVSRLCRLFLFLAPLALIDSPVSHAQAPAAVDFQRDIKPIFAKHCYSCHGPDKQKSGLRLDLKKAARAGGDGGVVILPGKSAESRLYRVISGSDPDGTVMPPKGDRLTPAQVDFIKRWIDEGAPWPDEGQAEAKSKHWAFQPIRRPAVPSVKDQEWVRNPIDAFILARLEKEGIKPAPMADRFTLLRRLSLDLTGLPPTLQDIERYVSDQSTDAYEKMVDYYLASPHFGEQWARHWLDLARYADSDGYEKDLYRPHAWRWRDWVIDAYNHDLPFDRFTIKQIAGDLLPNAGMDDRLATGFHRNTLLNREGGVDIEEDRVKAVVDRVSTLGSTWLGLTVGCAECHSHKYDPISQREFYQLYAFFNSTDERDIVAPPARLLPRIEQARELFAQIQNQVVKEFHASEHWLPFETWRERAARQPAIWQLPDSYELPTFGANNGANLYPQEDGSFLVTGTVGGATHYIMMSNLRLDGITAIRVEALTDEMLPGHGPGWAPNGNFVLSELRVEAAPLKDVNNLKKYEIAFAVADYSQPTLEIGKAIDGDEKTGWAVDLPHLPIHGIDRAAVFVLKEPIKLGAPLRLKVSLVQNHGQSHTLGRVRVSYTNTDPKTAAAQTTPEPMRNLAAQPFDQLSADQKCRLIHYYLATFAPMAPLLRNYAESLAALLKAKGDIRGQVLVQRRTPRPTHIHVRGDFLHPGEAVGPGFLSTLHPYRSASLDRSDAETAALTRLDLARWLIDPANPLTARVTVNRIWQHVFGEGLVASVSDFGVQGDLPSHPELLDWLASEFIERGWRQKQIIRLIVTSHAYRQASATRPDLHDKDVKNRLLARQNRYRLTAENVRDQILAAGGMLNQTVGGPSVPTKTPRRGLYVQFKRSFPEALLTTFDAPAGTVTCPKRERSNTPLQALTLLNDELYVNAARALARSVLEGGPAGVDERLGRLFQRALTRAPTATELAALRQLLNQAQAEYLRQPGAAAELAGNAFAATTPPADAAAWTVVARAVLNLDEIVMRE